MANIASLGIYNINGDNVSGTVMFLGFPTQGCLLRDTSGSPTRSLSSGYNVYSAIQFNNSLYYCRETYSALVTLFG